MHMSEPITTDAAIARFDNLEPATEMQMAGRWTGRDIATGHPMDGMLAASYWYGKRFEGPDAVHPLVHRIPFWGERSVNPGLLPIRLLMALPLRDAILPLVVPLIAPLVSTARPRARLRTLSFRGRMHAAMCYDAHPIHDIFAVIDDSTLMGWMDYKGMERPYFFELSREG